MAKKKEIATTEQTSIRSIEQVESFILTIRGKQVILDRDLARLYGVETRVLNQAVQRNIERFPEDFMFRLTKEETEFLKSQIVILETGKNMSSQFVTTSKDAADMSSQFVTTSPQKRPLSALPYAFTENGIAMLSSVLRSPMAISTNIQIMRAFNAMRHFIGSHAQVFQRLEVIEHMQLSLAAHQEELSAHQTNTDQKIEEVFKRLDEGAATPKEAIFYEGQFFEARLLLEQIIKTATKRVIIIDGYIDAATFEMLDVRAKGVTADIYSDSEYKTLRDAYNASKGKQPINTHKWSKSSHDRWVIIDDTLYHCGHSVKDLGKKLSAIMKMDWDPEVVLKEVR